MKTLVEQRFEHYGAPKEVHSDENVRIRIDTGWCKRVLDALNVHVTTGEPYTHTSNPLCERQNRVLEQNLRIQTKQERAKDCVRLLPRAVLNMKSQESSSTGYTPHELFHGGRPAWFFKTPFPQAIAAYGRASTGTHGVQRDTVGGAGGRGDMVTKRLEIA